MAAGDTARSVRRKLAWLAGAAACIGAAMPAAAESYLYGYFGQAWTGDTDLSLRQPSRGNDVTFSDVEFVDRSFERPWYYGFKAGHYFEGLPWFGLEVEFFHFKAYALEDKTYPVSGTRSGAPIGGSVRMDTIVQSFNISHGVNVISLNALARHGFMPSARFPHGRLQAYGGVGLGAVINHAEAVMDGLESGSYQLDDSPSYQVLLGFRYFPIDLGLTWGNPAIFTEYKFTHITPDFDINQGSGEVTFNTHHIVFGLGWHF